MMQTIEDAVYLRLRGKRRPGGLGNLWVPDVNHRTWETEFEEDFIVLPQIENQLDRRVKGTESTLGSNETPLP